MILRVDSMIKIQVGLGILKSRSCKIKQMYLSTFAATCGKMIENVMEENEGYKFSVPPRILYEL